ncbi:MAG: Fe-S cluster assembly protein SufD [Bacteroidota bacterium]
MNHVIQANLKENIQEAFTTFEKQLNGQRKSKWHQKRVEALNTLQGLSYPTVRHEEWKYTNLTKLLSNNYAFNAPSNLDKAAVLAFSLQDLDAHKLVFINGVFKKEFSSYSSEKGIHILSLKEAYKEHSELIEANFGKYAEIENEPFTALSTAFALDGVFILAEKSSIASKPVFVLSITDTAEYPVIAQPRNLVLAEENAQITIIEDFVSIGENPAFLNYVSEFKVDKHAHVDHYKLQNKAAKNFYVGTTQVQQSNNSNYNNTVVTLGGGLVRNNLNILLDGEHCEAFMNGLFMLKDQDHVDNHTMVDHMKPNSYSNELYKGVLDGRSTGVFNGKIYVRKYAQKTNAFQENKNILLSENATVDTKPQLEIWADDVKCSHGATTGALDEEPLFYLRSRGIGEDKARALLMNAFAADVISRIKSDAFKKHIEELIGNRLSNK